MVETLTADSMEQTLAGLMPDDSEAQAGYSALVVGLVGGEKFETAYIRETLAAANRSPADLAGDCRRLHHRKEALEQLAAAPADDATAFRQHDQQLSHELQRIEREYREGLARVQQQREKIDTQKRAAQGALSQSRAEAEKIVAATIPVATLAELGGLQRSLDELQRRRLQRLADVWRWGKEAALRQRIQAEQGRLSELVKARGAATDGARAMQATIDRLQAALGHLASARQEATDLAEQEAAIVAKHNELAATVYDWRNFELTIR
jgi:chromosome segregation ATPase